MYSVYFFVLTSSLPAIKTKKYDFFVLTAGNEEVKTKKYALCPFRSHANSDFPYNKSTIRTELYPNQDQTRKDNFFVLMRTVV